MLVEKELSERAPQHNTIVTVGVFDGVHHGHRHLISELLRQAHESELLSVAVTFRQHPENLFRPPDSRLSLLTDVETRVGLLQAAGVDIVIPLTFDKELAELNAQDFIELLQTHLHMRGVVIGSDFALGKNREGNVDRLLEVGRELGFSVTVVPPLVIDGITVSSTTIRKALSEGNMERVTQLTGRYFRLTGKVVTGVGRGTGLGYPTANITVDENQALPPDGVYACIATLGNTQYPAMTNIGNNPTFGNEQRTIESFILDYHGNLYEQTLSIDFVHRLREEIKFKDIEDLQKQIVNDIAEGRKILQAVVSNR